MRSRAAVVVAAVAVVLLLAGNVTALLVVDFDDDSAEEAVRERRANLLDTVLPELVAFVEQARGLTFTKPPKVLLLSDENFNARLIEGEPEETDVLAEQEAYLGFLRALGLIEGDVDLETVIDEQIDYIVGFYDTQAKALFVRGTTIDAYVKTVIIHELTHALDDQHFNLDRPDLDDDDGVAFEALVEGSALAVEERWYNSRPAEEQAAIAAAEESFGVEDPVGVQPEPDVFTELLSFPYVIGPQFVRALVDAGGQARLNAAFEQPPLSSEQVLHPEKFLAGEAIRAVADPQADGAELERGSLGQLGLILVLDGAMERDTALRAAAGWGGDSYVTWLSGPRTCLRWNIVMDNTRETNEAVAALRTWAGSSPGATVRGTSPITVTSCG